MGKPNAMKYDGVAMILHWLIAGLMIFMLFFGEELMEAEHGEVSTGVSAPDGASPPLIERVHRCIVPCHCRVKAPNEPTPGAKSVT